MGVFPMSDASDAATTDENCGQLARDVIVRQFGLLDPLDWGPDCEEELQRETAFWNVLVEIERNHREAFIKMTADDPAVAEIETSLTAKIEERREHIDARKAARKAARKKVPTEELDKRIEVLSAEIRSLAETAKARRKTARDSLKEPLRVLELARRDAVKRARQNSGLWWGNYNAVAASYERARQMTFRRKAELHFHRHDGGGRFTNQIQGGMTTDALFSSGHSQVQVSPLRADAWTHPCRGERRRLQRTTMTATVFTRDGQRRSVSWPMIMHRPIPDDSLIKEVVVSRRRQGNAWRWSVTFTCSRMIEPPRPAETGQIKAIDLGWRKVEGGLRVATVLAEGQAHPTHIILPQAILDGFAYADDIRGERDDMLNEVLPKVRAIDWTQAPPTLAAIGQAVKAAPKIGFGRVASLAIAWREHSDWRAEDYELLEAWRKDDKRLWIEEFNLRDKLQGRRRDFYRNQAKALVAGVRVVILEEFDLAEAAKVKRENGQENVIPAPSRHYRTVAAIHELRKWVELQAVKVSAEICRHSGVSTWLCHACGLDVHSAHPESLIQSCSNGHVWDQDENACRNMLAGYDASAPVSPDSQGALAEHKNVE